MYHPQGCAFKGTGIYQSNLDPDSRFLKKRFTSTLSLQLLPSEIKIPNPKSTGEGVLDSMGTIYLALSTATLNNYHSSRSYCVV